MLDASAAVYGLASAEEFAGQQLVERLLDPAEPADAHRVALQRRLGAA